MTVIAWDGKTLAADRRCTAAGLQYSVQKLHRVKDVVFAVSGAATDALAFKAWVEDGMNITNFPKVSDNFVGLLVEKGKCFLYEGARGSEILEQFHALGSGRDYAIAAMHCGKTAREAVEIACIYDIFCGNGVDSERVTLEHTLHA